MPREYKRRRNWVGKVIYWGLCKKFKFDHAKEWYIQKTETYPGERDAPTTLRVWDTNGSLNLGQTTRNSDSQQKKEILPNSGLYRPGKTTEWNWRMGKNHQRIWKWTRKNENKNTIGDYPKNSTAKINQNTEKSPEDETYCQTNSSERPSNDASV